MRPAPSLLLALPLALSLAACKSDGDDDDGGGGGGTDLTYDVRGQVSAWNTDDTLPDPTTLAVEIFDAWETNADPFAANAPVLARPILGADGAFDEEVTEDAAAGPVAALVVDDAPGQPDRVVATINDRRVDQTNHLAAIDGFAVDRTRAEGWLASPVLEGSDPIALGAAVITFIDGDRAPVAGVVPGVGGVAATEGGTPPEVTVYFFDADGLALEDATTTATTASGMILVVGAPGFLVSGQLPGGAATFEILGGGTRPGTLFVETDSQLAP